MVDDGIQHGAAVGDPLEGNKDARWEVRSTRLTARALNDVDSEEWQIAGDEHREQDSQHLYPHHYYQYYYYGNYAFLIIVWLF